MRTLDLLEVALVSGGVRATPKDPGTIARRAEPGDDVRDDPKKGNATGWCRGFGNLKEARHGHVDCDPLIG